jgi:hypothetical protein
VIAIDEADYVPLAELGAEFLFQVIHNARLCKALLDRMTTAPTNQLVEMKELGADGVLSKAFDLDVLSAAMGAGLPANPASAGPVGLRQRVDAVVRPGDDASAPPKALRKAVWRR